MLTNSLFYLFSNVLIISAFMVIFVQNAVYSVLFLVLSFISAASLLFLLECEFIAFMFIIIYVGAIAILFLFVVMMLDIKILNIGKDSLKYFPFGSFIGIIFLIEILILVQESFKLNPYQFHDFFNWYDKIDAISEIEAIGQVLYTHYVLQFLVAGNILLLATVGVVVLTVNTNTVNLKNQVIFKQLARNYKNVLLF